MFSITKDREHNYYVASFNGVELLRDSDLIRLQELCDIYEPLLKRVGS